MVVGTNSCIVDLRLLCSATLTLRSLRQFVVHLGTLVVLNVVLSPGISTAFEAPKHSNLKEPRCEACSTFSLLGSFSQRQPEHSAVRYAHARSISFVIEGHSV
eukprot:5096658-Amphidinium_carterae.1